MEFPVEKGFSNTAQGNYFSFDLSLTLIQPLRFAGSTIAKLSLLRSIRLRKRRQI